MQSPPKFSTTSANLFLLEAVTPMKDLATFQDAFQRAVIDGDEDILADIAKNPKEDRQVLLGVYQNAYVLRLIEFLSNDYEKLHSLLGDEQFDEMARAYIAANTSTTRNARWYGARLPNFLYTTAPFKDTPIVADMAQIELAIVDVFDAEDAPILSLEDLTATAPDAWPTLTFAPHPSIRRFDMSSNADDIWRALHNEQDVPAPETLSEPRRVIAYRSDGMATFRVMAADEAMMWDEAANGVTFSVLCEMLSMFAGEDEAPARAAGYLQGWIAAEMLAAS